MLTASKRACASASGRQLMALLPAAKTVARGPARQARSVHVHASADSPVRQAVSQIAINIYKASAMFSAAPAGLSPLWTALNKLDLSGVKVALKSGADVNERDGNGDTALLYVARAGHYKYPPSEIPAALIQGGADLEAADKSGLTALQVSLLAGWQNIAELLIQAGAATKNVGSIKGRVTCPDCKRVIAKYNL